MPNFAGIVKHEILSYVPPRNINVGTSLVLATFFFFELTNMICHFLSLIY